MKFLFLIASDQKHYHSLSEFSDIAFRVLKSDFNSKDISVEEFLAGVENWLPLMLNTPLFEDIRERPLTL